MSDSPYPLSTERLTLRFPRAEDVEVLTAYRNDPEVAALQDWGLPYPEERARELVAQHEGVTDLRNGGQHQVMIEQAGRLVGDLFVGLHEQGGVADIGFTLARSAQGQGIAYEAASAVVDDLVGRLRVHRVVAELSTENLASARLLERLGMTFEAHTRKSFWWRGEWDDNLYYSMTGDERRAWRDRPRTPPTDVRLVEIDHTTFRTWTRLEGHRTQRRFVAGVEESFVEALFPGTRHGVPLIPVLRGIEADGEPVGLLLWSETEPRPYLWRLLVDRRHQGRGIGRRTLESWVRDLRESGHSEAETAWVQAKGGPEPFCLAFGFAPTGEPEDGEVIARLRLT